MGFNLQPAASARGARGKSIRDRHQFKITHLKAASTQRVRNTGVLSAGLGTEGGLSHRAGGSSPLPSLGCSLPGVTELGVLLPWWTQAEVGQEGRSPKGCLAEGNYSSSLSFKKQSKAKQSRTS